MEARPWKDLPRELLVDIFCRVGFEDRYNGLPFVCKSWARASRDSLCWVKVDMEDCFEKTLDAMANWWSPPFEMNMDSMIKNVVDWSAGSLRELHTRHCSDAAIVYLASRCTQLNSLSVKESPSFTDIGAVAVAKMCPALEHLDITDCHNVTVRSLMELGNHCEHLITLKRNMSTVKENFYRRQFIPWQYLQPPPFAAADKEAEVISSSMPELRTFEYRYSGLSDTGLFSLTKLTKLEHLDLFGCKRLSMPGMNWAEEKMPNLKCFHRPCSPSYVDTLRYGHWQLYSERFDPLQF